MRTLVLSIGLALSAAVAAPGVAQNAGVSVTSAPGQVSVAKIMHVTTTVTAIDKASREVTLKGPGGHELTVEAGPEVKNFDQIKVGDQVNAAYVDALTLKLLKGGKEVVATTEQTGAVGAKPGAQPAGAVARQVTMVADVIGLNPATQTVTLKGPQHTVDLVVHDPAQFKLISKGDQIQVTYTEALAMALAPAAKK